MIDELEKADSSHKRRAAIGDRLSQIGDPREGVGVDITGVPQIKWISLPPGHIVLKDNVGSQDITPFYIAKSPVTYCQYRAFLNAEDGYTNPRWWHDLERTEVPGKQRWPIDNHPTENLSFYDATAFCRWLSDRLGYTVRLPTEYEWQQAATMGNPDNTFPWSPEWNDCLANTSESRLSRTTAVGMYPLGRTGGSLEGIMDMSGNLWEWCLNKYKNPDDTSVSGKGARVWRGGSWHDDQGYACASVRLSRNPHSRSSSLGFRFCCESPIA